AEARFRECASRYQRTSEDELDSRGGKNIRSRFDRKKIFAESRGEVAARGRVSSSSPSRRKSSSPLLTARRTNRSARRDFRASPATRGSVAKRGRACCRGG